MTDKGCPAGEEAAAVMCRNLLPLRCRESMIRHMTRLAHAHNAINLSQGVPSESPCEDLRWAAICAIAGGNDSNATSLAGMDLCSATHKGLCFRQDVADQGYDKTMTPTLLKDIMLSLTTDDDCFNQYAIPFGTVEIRQDIADYYYRLYGFRPDPDTEITVTLGATEAMSSTLRALIQQGDGVIIIQPFHEMYVNQVELCGGVCEFVSLREDIPSEGGSEGVWRVDEREIEAAMELPHVKIIVLNTPHNPTGKVFSLIELQHICAMCITHRIFIVTDEIYEHLIYQQAVRSSSLPVPGGGIPSVHHTSSSSSSSSSSLSVCELQEEAAVAKHHCLFGWPDVRGLVICANSMSKTGSCTGWRLGWTLAAAPITQRIRAVHDTISMQAPTPFQTHTSKIE
eukprot:GHVQ01029596.1.p1 GENE.GHVQ01029596.1~~GHVQ01029596.1.p1  ORF type:complete len:398 (-),score=74.34 GHVQ01029596.1:360-1553(-)